MTDQLRKTAKRLYGAGHDLIPLIPGGKKPIQSKWTTRPRTSAAEIKAALEKGCNIGLRLKPEDLILDVDVKGGARGLASYDLLCQDFPELSGLDHCTHTPSGGFHVWLSKPPGKLRKTHATYPGVDFLFEGSQVLIGGCEIESGTYVGKPVKIFPAASGALLDALSRAPAQAAEYVNPGAWDNGKLLVALSTLDPADHRGDDAWLRIGMACHHATNGNGREAFLDWSALDPLYGLSRRSANEERWDSFKTDRPGGVTGNYLTKVLREAEEFDLAEELNSAMAETSGMFEVMEDQGAAQYALCLDLIGTGDQPHNLPSMCRDIVGAYPFNEAAIEQLAYAMHKRFVLPIAKVRGMFTVALLEAKKAGEINGVATGEEVEMIHRMIDASGEHGIINTEGRIWAWSDERGHYRECVGDGVTGVIMRYANDAAEKLSKGALSRLETLLRAETAGKAPAKFWEQKNDPIINTGKGEVVLESGAWEIRPHDRAHRLRNVTSIEFGHTGTPKHWLGWLNDAFDPDELDIMSDRLAVGITYTMMNSRPFLKKSWMLYGPPNTGKSMCVDVVGRMVGEQNCSSTALSKMLGNHGTAPLVGKMANLQSEMETGDRMDASVFKAIVAGDPMEANPKNAHQFMFRNQAILWMAGNDLPKFATDTTRGVVDRIVPVAFRNAVADDKRDFKLIDKLTREINLIATWAMGRYAEQKEKEFPCLKLSGKSDMEVEMQADMVSEGDRFVQECLIFTGDLSSFTYKKDIMERYNDWTHSPRIEKAQIFGSKLGKMLRGVPGAIYKDTVANDGKTRIIKGVILAEPAEDLEFL